MWRLCPFLLKSPGTGIDQDHHSTAQFNLQQKNQIHHDQVDFKTDVPMSAKTVHTATAVCAHPLSPRRSPDLLKTMLFPFFLQSQNQHQKQCHDQAITIRHVPTNALRFHVQLCLQINLGFSAAFASPTCS